MTGLSLTVHQNEYLAPADTEMHAVLAVTAHGLGTAANGTAPEAAEVIAIDCSGSMAYPPTKIAAARRATAAAIDALRDGVHFAVIKGQHTATLAFPTGRERTVVASPETKEAAKAVVRRLDPNGGTAMGTWLNLAGTLLDAHPKAIRHVMLLTDGKNETETPRELEEVLLSHEGRFVCDARGIGDDWSPRELLRIVSVLHGSADAIRTDQDLVDDFATMMHGAMSKVVPDVRLRVRMSRFARLRFLKQSFPLEADITELGTPVGEQDDHGGHTVEFSTGSWGAETKHFRLCLEVDPVGLPTGEDILAARADLAVVRAGTPEEYGQTAAIRVHWTDDARRSSVVAPDLAHYERHEELRNAVDSGCAAYETHDWPLAATHWEHAMKLADDLGNTKTAERVRGLLMYENGAVRVKPGLSPRDLFAITFSSRLSTRGPESAKLLEAKESRPAAPDHECPACGHISPATAVFCPSCRTRLRPA
jgi:Ca-activated chloride channel family protein